MGHLFVSVPTDLLAVPSWLRRPLGGTFKWFPVILPFRANLQRAFLTLLCLPESTAILYSTHSLCVCSGKGAADTECSQSHWTLAFEEGEAGNKRLDRPRVASD